MDSVPAAREPAQPWEPFFVPQGTVLAAVRCLLRRRRRPRRPQAGDFPQAPLSLRRPTDGVHPGAMFGKRKAAVTTQIAKRKDQKNAGGSTSLQVILSAFKLV